MLIVKYVNSWFGFCVCKKVTVGSSSHPRKMYAVMVTVFIV